jgi:Ferritin-like domain
LNPRTAPARLDTPTDLPADGVREISAALNALIADTFALYVKTKNFHWHVSGPHFRDYHLLLDEQGEQLAASIDILAERARKVGGTTIRSIGHIAKLQRIKDNDSADPPHARGPRGRATSTRTWRPPVFWRISLTKRKSAAGSCSRPAARPSDPATRSNAALAPRPGLGPAGSA